MATALNQQSQACPPASLFACGDCGMCCKFCGYPPFEPDETLYAIVEKRGIGICSWFDEASGKCSNYDIRPRACREYEVGGQECIELRIRSGKHAH